MKMWRTQIFHCVLFLLVFVETYRDDEQCAVCLEEGCKTGVSRIILDKCDKPLWQKKNKIPECSVGNLKPDAPCMISNGNLVLRTEQPLHFEDTDVGKIFHSTNMPCADLDLPAGLKPSSEQCAVCLEEGCKTGVNIIILDKCDETLWHKKNKIPECSVGNLKPDTPCMMSNGNLVLRTEQTLHFGGTDVGKIFHSTNMLCADLDLPPSLKSSSGAPDLNQINATANPTTTPASAWPPWKIAITVCGSVAVIGVIAIVVYRRRHKRRREGQDGERPPDNNVEMDLLNRDDEHS